MAVTKIVQHGGGWFTNIGNAFIDYGSMYALDTCMEDADVHLTSSHGKWITSQMKRGVADLLTGTIRDNDNAFRSTALTDADYVVQSGTCLSDHWFSIYGEELKKAKERGAKLIFHGVGMTDDTYTESEIEKCRSWVSELGPHALITRDEKTFENYKDLAEHSYNGIDCGFFVNEYYDPLEFSLPSYSVVNFDKRPEPDLSELGIDTDEVIRTHHSFWLDFDLTDFPKMRNEYYKKSNVLISDLPQEYLNVYAGSSGTYSDRVHACVASIAYGNPARLMHDTPRSLLFERVGMGAVTKSLHSSDLGRLEDEKMDQIKFLSEIL